MCVYNEQKRSFFMKLKQIKIKIFYTFDCIELMYPFKLRCLLNITYPVFDLLTFLPINILQIFIRNIHYKN